ncbi:MAG: hypothetical protein LBC85_06500 [Fibromonadaceae bacterium]|nr:hypothetical protein [Fibromonadaceae bacterium]
MKSLFLSFLILATFISQANSKDWRADPNLQVLKAFPGAEGFGAYTTGGRGGRVLYVTNLNDAASNPPVGSLRWAVNQTGARTIMFQVAGEIKLAARLRISNDNLTIAGHSAPGDGIVISGNTVYVGANNVIIRYMRFRMGDLNDIEDDAIWGRNQRDIIIDHSSMSWGTDECASFYDNENFTLQWSVLSESLRTSVHEKGNHGYLGIWGGRRASFHHNLIAHHDSRNPRFNGARYSNRASEELVDFRNNVIYNWGANSGYAGEGGRYNMVNNYYKPGPQSANSARIFQPNADNGNNSQAAGVWGTFYVAGNYMLNANGTPNTAVNNDNWVGIHPNPSSKNKSELRSNFEFEKGDITTHTAQEAYELVLARAGASFRRDATDIRVVNEVRNGLAPVRASGGAGTRAGMIDSQRDVGGWDTYTFNPSDVPIDTDGGGIPDYWKIANGLPLNDPSVSNSTSLAGTYTNLEVYLYDLLETGGTSGIMSSSSRQSSSSSRPPSSSSVAPSSSSRPSSSSVAPSSSSRQSSSSSATPSSSSRALSSSSSPPSSSSNAETPSSSSAGSTHILLSYGRDPSAPPLYYDLKGTPLGTTKPTAPGVYIEKHGKQIRKIAVSMY